MKIPIRKSSSFTPQVLTPEECLAKTLKGEKGCDVVTHLQLCTLVLRALKECFLQTPKAAVFSEAAEYLAAVHDIGKATPGFQLLCVDIFFDGPVVNSKKPKNFYCV